MAAELFKAMTGTDIVHVPHKAAGDSRNAVIGGHIEMMFDAITTMASNAQAGQVRALGTTATVRSKVLPDVPTIAEAGVPGYAGTSWFALAAPSSMPRELVEKVNRDANRGLAAQEAVARLDALGVTFTPNTPAEAAAFFKSETAKWNRVIEAANIRLD